MTDKINFTPDYGEKAKPSSIIKVIGVGGGGSNAVKHMYSEGIVGVDFLICNTDRGHLDNTPVPDKLLLGNGLGAGAQPEVARQYAMESKERIQEFIGKETRMLFITAGMGKGTGTGASPVIAEIAHDMGILTIGVVTTPFKFEGSERLRLANEGIAELSQHVDSLITIKNQNVIKYYNDEDIDSAFGYADDVLKNAVKCIAELITVNYAQNVDFNDVQTVMKDSGKAMLGLAVAKGENRVEKVVQDALDCPLLDENSISEAQNFLFFISYGPENKLKMSELDSLTDKFEKIQSRNARVIWGRGLDESLGDAIKLSVIVTKFNSNAEKSLQEKSVYLGEQQPTESSIFVEEQPTNDAGDFGTLIDSTPVEKPKEELDSNPFGFTMHQQPAGPQKIKEDGEVFPNFDFVAQTPAINRYKVMESKSTETATLDFQPMYEGNNDIKELFTDLAD
ncbi:MAG: cell division protein FtsZ [Bacteroidales bacterium]|nr:cell division protein FtsZ [Bacteroidales bacterium]